MECTVNKCNKLSSEILVYTVIQINAIFHTSQSVQQNSFFLLIICIPETMDLINETLSKVYCKMPIIRGVKFSRIV